MDTYEATERGYDTVTDMSKTESRLASVVVKITPNETKTLSTLESIETKTKPRLKEKSRQNRTDDLYLILV